MQENIKGKSIETNPQNNEYIRREIGKKYKVSKKVLKLLPRTMNTFPGRLFHHVPRQKNGNTEFLNGAMQLYNEHCMNNTIQRECSGKCMRIVLCKTLKTSAPATYRNNMV
jgi:hypothetical protein